MTGKAAGVIAALVVLAGFAAPAVAQVPPVPAVGGLGGQQNPEDTVSVNPFRYDPPISPVGALLRSILVPGWGQTALDRRVSGAVFIFWEGITLAMTVKSKHQLGYMERAGHEAAEAKKAEYQDWLVLLVFNHLFSGAEAFVGANLWDFPDEIRFTPLPGNRFGVTGSIPIRR